MKANRAMITGLLISVAAATPAFARGGRVDNSGFWSWGFLAFCALIVVAQVLPAIMMATGIIKGAAEHKEAAREVAR